MQDHRPGRDGAPGAAVPTRTGRWSYEDEYETRSDQPDDSDLLTDPDDRTEEEDYDDDRRAVHVYPWQHSSVIHNINLDSIETRLRHPNLVGFQYCQLR